MRYNITTTMESFQSVKCQTCGKDVPFMSLQIHELVCAKYAKYAPCSVCGGVNFPRHELEHKCEICNMENILDIEKHQCKTPEEEKECPCCTLLGCDIVYCYKRSDAIIMLMEKNGITERKYAEDIINGWIKNGKFQENYNRVLRS
jgi:hypothetical protein